MVMRMGCAESSRSVSIPSPLQSVQPRILSTPTAYVFPYRVLVGSCLMRKQNPRRSKQSTQCGTRSSTSGGELRSGNMNSHFGNADRVRQWLLISFRYCRRQETRVLNKTPRCLGIKRQRCTVITPSIEDVSQSHF
ncbi:uncharacterized protein LOC120321877 [Drosophila yakuba]|uniref:uncharacterized protein LOC120321877 n=1 Tax=Drosophila yakuba TaxID=7245 RepID=UPI0019307DED|nr:uncharacterized protein LOC120321877 [Drosophila yakuba]